MNDGTLVQKNLWRKPLRTTLLIVSIFIAFLLYGFLGSFNYLLNYAENPNSANRLVTTNKIGFTQPLPYNYLTRIRSMEGVTAATMMNWFGGYYQDRTNQIQTMAVEPGPFRQIYSNDFVMSDAEWEAFSRERTGIIIGKDTADRFGWRVGQRIPLRSDIYTNRTTGQQAWDFTIVGIFTAAEPANPASGAYYNYEYFRESATFGGDSIGMVSMSTASAENNDAIAQRIDAAFRNSLAETKTQDEAAFGRAFIAQIGDIGLIITLVVGSAFAAILLVVGNTAMMSVRERTKEIGVMKTLGFSSNRIMRMVLSESMRLALIGGGLGLGVSALMLLAIQPFVREFLGALSMNWIVALIGIVMALLFGLITGLAPAMMALNLKINDALSRK